MLDTKESIQWIADEVLDRDNWGYKLYIMQFTYVEIDEALHLQDIIICNFESSRIECSHIRNCKKLVLNSDFYVILPTKRKSLIKLYKKI